jgi:YVTN family beta-propeller protein
MRIGFLLCLLCTGLASAQYLETTLDLGYSVDDMVWNPANNHLYVSNYDKGTVKVIDCATNLVTSEINVAPYADNLCLNPLAQKVYCASGESNELSVIDATADTLIKTVASRGYPMRMACNTLMNKLYVICTDDNVVRVYDGAGDSLMDEIGFGVFNTPYYLIWHPLTNRVFCVTSSDADPDTLFVIDCNTDLVAAKTLVGNEPRFICRNPADDMVYLSCRRAVNVLSAHGDSVIAVVEQPVNNSACICAVPFPNKVYSSRGDWIHVIDCSNHVVSDSIEANTGVSVCDTRKAKVYAAARPPVVIDARGDSVLMTVPVSPCQVVAVVWNSVDCRIYMLDVYNSVVYVIRDTTTGVTEPGCKPGPRRSPFPTVCRGVLRLDGDATAVLLDLIGRQAAVLKPGSNDVRGLKSGVYFVRLDKSALTRKVIIQN